MKTFLKMFVAILLVAALAGCGGDGGSPQDTNSDTYVFPARKSAIAFSAISTAHLSVPISAIDISLTLPKGMSVATSGGSSGQIDNASIMPGSGLLGTNLAFGSYSTSSSRVHLSMATTNGNYRSGEFLRLFCTVSPGITVTLGKLRALNTPVLVSKVVGYDPVTKSTVVLTNNVKVSISASP